MPSKAAAPDKRPAVTNAEYALCCWLRLHPHVAMTYGIEACDGSTGIGSMLMQVLQHLGMHAEWYKQLPNGVPAEDATPNEKSAAWVKQIGKKPGPRRKAFSDHPQVVPPPDAAVQRTGSAAVVPVADRRPVEALTIPELKQELTAHG